ncbi:LOW QUALITY PROTEIN: inhibitory synaptic factor 1 [Protopterus annectens]|uniref:LOW QUALITY PROTEIN: inhibitory synaptic factor 1 n=1 Tax=Protopterus annectens TaxID=7888 RepID=UPI001CFAAD95|nr:LOW QUALITY PROTEIN: inhibitory synaptic factor 1 [Protopterus annectens]
MSSRATQDSETSERPSSERERIRSHMKMVIGQLEGILQELKDVAKELREVVSQIDQLTADFEFDLEADDWTTATVSSTSSSDTLRNNEKGCGMFDVGQLDFLTPEVLSDSWEFCSFLEPQTPSDCGKSEGGESTEQSVKQPDYRLMNGGLNLTPNGPGIVTPSSSSDETLSSIHSHKTTQRTSGTRERVRFSDKVLYHALCCDDEEEEEEPKTAVTSPVKINTNGQQSPSPISKLQHQLSVGAVGNPHNTLNPKRKLTKNSSTQTVCDKSTQTVLPYIPNKQKVKGKT